MNKYYRVFWNPDGDGGGGNGESGTGLFGSGLLISKDGVTTKGVADPKGGETPPAQPIKEGEAPPATPPVAPAEKPPFVAKPAVDRPRGEGEKGPGAAKFREVTDARDKALKDLETERAAWAKERATLQEQSSKTDVPEEFKRQLAEALASKTALEKDLHEYVISKQAQSEFGGKRTAALDRLSAIAAAAGDTNMVAAAKRADYEALADFAENGNLSSIQRRDINRLIDEARSYDDQLAQKLSDPEAAWKSFQDRIQNEQTEAVRARISQHVTMAEGVHAKIVETVPALKNLPELSASIKKDLVALAGGEGNERFPAQEIMKIVGEHRLYQNLAKNQAATIEELKAKLAEKEETVKTLKSPRFNAGHLEQENNDPEDVGTGLFNGGLKVNIGR